MTPAPGAAVLTPSPRSAEEASRGCDNILSRMIELKRSQLMRAARLRRRRALGAGGGDSSGSDGAALPLPDERRRRVLHKARSAGGPPTGRGECVSGKDFAVES